MFFNSANSAQTAEAKIGTQWNTRTHSELLGLPAELLVEVLLPYAAGELHEWDQLQEAAEPGRVGSTGNAPDWLEPHLDQLPGEKF
jgi:hypothetical protein